MDVSVWRPAPRPPLSSSEQAILEAVVASTEIPARVRKRAGIILRAAEGVPNSRIAEELKIHRSFSDLPAAGRNCLINVLLGEFRKLEKRRRTKLNAKVFNSERLLVDRFLKFVMVIAAKHAAAQNHLLLKCGAIEYPTVQKWLAKQPCIQLHLAPLSPPNGPQWTELAEHWLKVISAWPTQASLVESIKQMTQLLATYPPGQLNDLVIC
jgi:hypothetical protein